MRRRGEVTLPVILSLSGMGVLGSVVAMLQAPVPPEQVWQGLVALVGQGGATVFALFAWDWWKRKQGQVPSGMDEIKFMAALEVFKRSLKDDQDHGRQEISKDVANALTIALKEVELLLEKHASRERRSG